jgi:hypothetical protein
METRKKQEKYSCSICAFTTVRKSNFDCHLLSLTHKKEQEKTIKTRIMRNFTFIP